MNIKYDSTVDALAIDLAKGRGKITTTEVRPGVHLDFDEDGRCVGLELLDASFHMPKADLAKIGA